MEAAADYTVDMCAETEWRVHSDAKIANWCHRDDLLLSHKITTEQILAMKQYKTSVYTQTAVKAEDCNVEFSQ